MKYLKISMLVALIAVFMVSCSKDDDITPNNINEIENLQLIKSFSKDGYTLELFNKSGKFQVGYNQITLRLKDSNGKYAEQASLEWMPMMTMNMGGMTHEHSSPFSKIKKVNGKQTLFEGYIVFIMASDGPDNYWNLMVDISVNGQDLMIHENINVISTETEYNKVYTSGMGTDDVNYMLALIEPSDPKIGTNDIVVGLFKMGENHDFPIVDNYKIKVDPRMPGMGNHSAPGNVDMTQGNDGFYHGKVGFSMSGYWKINLILEDGSGTVIKGEPVTETNPESSLNFKIEF
ncbi:MAG: FixH family protein [Chitinophagales bacterium]|nr:FixH family protein [Chitinophagales bacterium]